MLVSDKTSVIQLFSAFLPLLVALLLEGHCLTQWFNLLMHGFLWEGETVSKFHLPAHFLFIKNSTRSSFLFSLH